MSDREAVVIVDHVWKKFRSGEHHNSLRDLIPSMTRRLVKKREPAAGLQQKEFWALQDISFQVRPGEALGIIGPNGAGKSTALKLLTKLMRPTRGHCQIKGRVGALIEVAAGFHPDLTGRENVFLQGAIMGMKRVDITRKLDDIIEFSGLEKFIDMQVKRYSSGMNARLGFSIAARLDPDVLIIDEVLAVGDMAFQQRCIDRMLEFKRDGVAIVFVSHNLEAVARLCTHALFIGGVVKADGSPEQVIQAYVSSASAVVEAASNDPLQITSAVLLDDREAPLARNVHPADRLIFRASYLPKVTTDDVTFRLLLFRSTDNMLLYEGHFSGEELGIPKIIEGEPFTIDYRFDANLVRGNYYVVTRVLENASLRFLSEVCPPGIFVVDELRTWAGMVHLNVKPTVSIPAAVK